MVKNSDNRLSMGQCIAYSSPHVVTALLMASLHVVQGIYVKHYGISLAIMAAILMFARIFDAVSDVVIGYLSDKYYRKTGTRKPLLAAGIILFIVAGYFLYMPGESVSPVYFALWMMLLYVGWTLFEIPHVSWASDLVSDTNEKTRVFSYRGASGYLGLLIFYIIPFFPIFDSSGITPETLKWCVALTIVIAIPSIFSCLIYVPDHFDSVSEDNKDSSKSLSVVLASIISNKPLRLFLAAYSCVGVAVGMWFGLLFIYLDSYLLRGDLFAPAFLISIVIGIASVPLWHKLSSRFGKIPVWSFSIVCFAVSMIYTRLLHPDSVELLDIAAVKTISTLGFVSMNIVAYSILSDISDYGHWKLGQSSTSLYFSFQVFLYKFTSGVGAAAGLAIASFYGFDVAEQIHSSEEIFGLHFAIAWLPTAFCVVAMFFVVNIPINTYRHSIINRRLVSRYSQVKC